MEIINVGGVATGVVPPGVRHVILVVVGVHGHRDADLFEIADAFGFRGLTFGFGQSWEEHAGEDRDDGNHNQQFNQSEGAVRCLVYPESGRRCRGVHEYEGN